jgi:hypothetical protein
MDLNDYDSIIKSLVGIAARMDLSIRRQEEHNADIKAFVQQQTVVNAQNTTLIMRLTRTLDHMDDTLERLDAKLERIWPEPSGR